MAIYRLYIGISNPSNANVYFFVNNQQYTNPSVVHSSHYDVVAFAVPILLTFIQIGYPAENLFQTQPTTIILVLFSLLAYCLSSMGFRMLISHSHDTGNDRYAGAGNWCGLAMRFFGFVSVSLLVVLLFPVILWICPLVLLLPGLLGLVLLLAVLLMVVVKFLRVQSKRRKLPLLPLTSTYLLRE